MSYWTDWYDAYKKFCDEWADGCDTMREHQSRWNRQNKSYYAASDQVNNYFLAHANRMNDEKDRRDAWFFCGGRKTA